MVSGTRLRGRSARAARRMRDRRPPRRRRAWRARSLRVRQPMPPPMSPRVLIVRRLTLSSRQTTSLTGFLALSCRPWLLAPASAAACAACLRLARCSAAAPRPRAAAGAAPRRCHRRLRRLFAAAGLRFRAPSFLRCALCFSLRTSSPWRAISSACCLASASRCAICSASTTTGLRRDGATASAAASTARRA